MAIYTTFFLCEAAGLHEGFPNWRLPLETPVRRVVRNPFTGEVMTIESREPEWPDHDEEDAQLEFHAIAIEGSYEDYLEGRLPSFVRNQPHWASKGLTRVELHPLLDLVDVQERVESAIYSPPSSGNVLERIPQEFVAKLSSLDVTAVAERWAAALSTAEHTHSAFGVKLSDGWTASETAGILGPLVALGRQATPAQQRYLLTEV